MVQRVPALGFEIGKLTQVFTQLLYLAVGAELLPPLHQEVSERTQEVSLIIRLDERGADKIETILRGI